MDIENNIKINVNVAGAITETEKFKNSLRGVDIQAEKTSRSVDDITGNGGAIAILDSLTRGLATRFKDAYEATRLFNFSLKGMRAALIATGIGALVVALGLIVAYWDEISDAIKGTTKNLEVNLILTKSIQQNLDVQLKTIDKQLELGKLQGKSNKQLELQKVAILKRLQEQNKAETRILENQLQRLKATETEVSFWDTIAANIKFTLFGAQGLAHEATRLSGERLKQIKDLQTEIDNAKLSAVDLEISLYNIDNPKQTKATTKDKAKDTTKDKAKDTTLENLQKIEDLENAYLDSKLDKIQQEKNAVLDKYFTEIELAKQFGLDTTILEEARQNELLEIDKSYKEEKEKAIQEIEDNYLLGKLEKEIAEIERKAEADIIELETLGAKKELIEAVEQESSDRINAIVKAASDETIKTEKEAADAKKKLDNEVLNAKLNMLGKMADGLSTLSEIAGKETAAGKGLAVAAATIDTIRGGVSAFTGMVDVIPGPVGVALGAVAAAGVVASGFASVKKILAVKVPGGGGGGSAPSGGGSAPSGGGGFTPNFNVVGASSQNQLAETVAGSTSEPTRAYVVYDDVKKAGDIESNAIAAAGI
jgi:hypothetical protein